MASFNDFIEALEEGLGKLVESGWKSYRKAATADAKQFLDKSKADLKRWTSLLAQGKLTKADFAWLVAGKKDLAKLVALKQAGLARVALDKFTNGVVDTIVSTAFKVFL